MPTIICPSNLDSTNNQIKALEAILPYDNNKDREIHERALNSLKEHRKELMNHG